MSDRIEISREAASEVLWLVGCGLLALAVLLDRRSPERPFGVVRLLPTRPSLGPSEAIAE